MSRATSIRVLIADHHVVIRGGLRQLLANQPDLEVVAEAADGLEAARLAESLLPTVAVMDVSMPVANGIEATKQIARACPVVRVIAFTRHRDVHYVRAMLAAGAAGYVLKQSSPALLLQALREVADGRRYLDPSVASFTGPSGPDTL